MNGLYDDVITWDSWLIQVFARNYWFTLFLTKASPTDRRTDGRTNLVRDAKTHRKIKRSARFCGFVAAARSYCRERTARDQTNQFILFYCNPFTIKKKIWIWMSKSFFFAGYARFQHFIPTMKKVNVRKCRSCHWVKKVVRCWWWWRLPNWVWPGVGQERGRSRAGTGPVQSWAA